MHLVARDSRGLTSPGRLRYAMRMRQGGTGMRRAQDNILDTTMLESLAYIAAAHDRSVAEELNRAVAAYVLEHLGNATASSADGAGSQRVSHHEGIHA